MKNSLSFLLLLISLTPFVYGMKEYTYHSAKLDETGCKVLIQFSESTGTEILQGQFHSLENTEDGTMLNVEMGESLIEMPISPNQMQQLPALISQAEINSRLQRELRRQRAGRVPEGESFQSFGFLSFLQNLLGAIGAGHQPPANSSNGANGSQTGTDGSILLIIAIVRMGAHGETN